MIALADEAKIAAGLELAADRNELFMLYQPKICVASGELAGVEALMRWHSADFGLLSPSLFIPIAERSGAIDVITDWGLRHVLRQWTEWRDQGLKTNVAFNISALSLRDVHFPDFLQRLCHIEGMPCDHLTIEVTEGATQHAMRLLDTITRFRIKGMNVELDDFGTGYSSLLQLRQLPYTALKIDSCFVADAAEHAEARLIVKTVIDLAHGLGLTATAEGVERRETLELLRTFGCDHAQGFLISEPLAPTELVPWVMRSAGEWRELYHPAAEADPARDEAERAQRQSSTRPSQSSSSALH
jgi:EAL domain-containing protein (putative c-di-GMP-specific phosphodiesterase class I)